MPRQARKLSRTGVYHVMLRGINRQDIFEDDEDYRQMTGCLRSLTERYDEMITSPHDPSCISLSKIIILFVKLRL